MVKQENTHQGTELLSLPGLWLRGGRLPALQTRSLNGSFSSATEFWPVPSLYQLLCWVLGLPRRCSKPVQAKGKETNIMATRNVLKWRKEAQEKGPGTTCVEIRALPREDVIQCISIYIPGALVFWGWRKERVRRSSCFHGTYH